MKTTDGPEAPEPDEEDLAYRFWMWVAHHELTVCVIWAVSWLTLNLWRAVFDETAPLGLVIFCVLGVAFVVAVPIAGVLHRRVIVCDWCHSRTPLDPQAAVEERRMQLYLSHRSSDRPWRYLFLILLIPLIFAPPGWWGLFAIFPILIHTVGIAVLGKWHRRLQPWCPWCHDDDDDDEHDEVPDPEPDPVIEKTPDDQKITLR